MTIYLDYAATTPIDPRVVEKMLPYLTGKKGFANPASSHTLGRAARVAVEEARAQIADCIGADPANLIFTSGATEANNLAIHGVAQGYPRKGRHIITTRLEHRSILDPCQHLARAGFEITYLDLLPNGQIDLDHLQAALRPDTVLVTILHANNEIGIVQDIEKIGQITRAQGVLLHVDAAQSAGKIPLALKSWPVDLVSLSAHKIYGPKGIGALYVTSHPRVHLAPLIHGGGHEQGLRSGTLATHQIVGMGEAFALAAREMLLDQASAMTLRNRLWKGISILPGLIRNTDFDHSLPNIVNISVEGVGGESLLAALDDFALSTGAACHSVSIEPSYVLRALGRSYDLAESSLRFSFGRFTTSDDIDAVVTRFIEAVQRLRVLSPRWGETLEKSEDGVKIGIGGGREHGKIVQLSLRVSQHQIIEESKNKAQGCVATMACAAWLATYVKGKSVEEALQVTAKNIIEALALPAEKQHCAMLARMALQEALHDYVNSGSDKVCQKES